MRSSDDDDELLLMMMMIPRYVTLLGIVTDIRPVESKARSPYDRDYNRND